MPLFTDDPLSRRERQVMNIIYAKGRATATEIHAALPDPPTFSATRAIIRTLEEKGHIRHEEDGQRYVYLPVVPRRVVSKSALKHVVNTFFDGSIEKVVAALLGPDGSKLSDEELDRIAGIVANAKAEEKR